MIQDATDITTDVEAEAIVEFERQVRRAQFATGLARIVFIGGSLTMIAFVSIWLLFAQDYIQLLAYAMSIMPLVLAGWLYPILQQRGWSKQGVILLLVSISLMLVAASTCVPQLLPNAALGFVVVIIMTFLLLDSRDSYWLLGFNGVVFPTLILLVDRWSGDLFANQLDETFALAVSSAMGLCAFILVVIIVRMVVMGQEDQFRRTQYANLEIERRAAAEREAKTQLENTVSEYMAFVARVTGGHLASRLALTANGSGEEGLDDLYLLGTNLNAMVENLSEMAYQVREAATAVSSAAAEIQAATAQQVASTAEQDAAVTQTVATVEEVRATVLQTSERAQSVANFSQESINVSRAGEDALVDAVEGMKLIQQRVESIAETILMLSERTQQIGEIIDSVNAIADQSKLLALNASIEAARAGEEGKGFAVVAMEVRQLAEQSREATSRVRDILGEIQKATNTAVMVTEEGSKGADAGMGLVERAGAAIRELAGTIEDAAQAATQIAASTHQQTNGMDQLASAMLQIKQASAQTAAGMRQTEQSVHDLMEMAHQLEQASSRYELVSA